MIRPILLSSTWRLSARYASDSWLRNVALMPTEISWPTFSSNDMRRSSSLAHFNAPLDGCRLKAATFDDLDASGALARAASCGCTGNAQKHSARTRNRDKRQFTLNREFISHLHRRGPKCETREPRDDKRNRAADKDVPRPGDRLLRQKDVKHHAKTHEHPDQCRPLADATH